MITTFWALKRQQVKSPIWVPNGPGEEAGKDLMQILKGQALHNCSALSQYSTLLGMGFVSLLGALLAHVSFLCEVVHSSTSPDRGHPYAHIPS